MSDIPKEIWLQWEHPDTHEGVTWCVDKINDEDEKYYHHSVVDELVSVLGGLTKALNRGEIIESEIVGTEIRANEVLAKHGGGCDE